MNPTADICLQAKANAGTVATPPLIVCTARVSAKRAETSKSS